jgi:hypothetical protein
MVKGMTVVGVSLHTVDVMSNALFMCPLVSLVGWPLAATGIASKLKSRLVHIAR